MTGGAEGLRHALLRPRQHVAARPHGPSDQHRLSCELEGQQNAGRLAPEPPRATGASPPRGSSTRGSPTRGSPTRGLSNQGRLQPGSSPTRGLSNQGLLQPGSSPTRVVSNQGRLQPGSSPTRGLSNQGLSNQGGLQPGGSPGRYRRAHWVGFQASP